MRSTDVKPAADLAGAAGDGAQGSNDTANIPRNRPRPQWRVTVHGQRVRTWSEYADATEAHRVAEQLRGHGMDARVDRIDNDPFASRRRFLILACMAGWIRPERVAERILAEVQEDAP